MSIYRIIMNFKPGGPGLSGPTQFISATQVFCVEFEGTRDELCMKVLRTMKDGGFYWFEEGRIYMVPNLSIGCVEVEEIEYSKGMEIHRLLDDGILEKTDTCQPQGSIKETISPFCIFDCIYAVRSDLDYRKIICRHPKFHEGGCKCPKEKKGGDAK